jgi:SAM-dependent methyltransferase
MPTQSKSEPTGQASAHGACDARGVLACPVDLLPLTQVGERLECDRGHGYPIVQGVPVLLRDDVEHTIDVSGQSLKLAHRWADGWRDDPFFVDTLGLSDAEREQVRAVLATGDSRIDPAVSHLIGATNGLLYKSLIGRLDRIPTPDTRLPPGNGQILLDIGCNWGRWSLAAAARGYLPIGIDPSLGAVLAAKRLAKMRNLPFEGIVGDARHLPLAAGAIDAAFSYSVLQHVSTPDAVQALRQVARALRPGGLFRIQMASAIGVRSVQHIVRRGFRKPRGFEVRYWLPFALKREFRRIFGEARLEVDCFFGLGLQASDRDLYDAPGRMLVSLSEALRRASKRIIPLRYAADSVYLVGRSSAG